MQLVEQPAGFDSKKRFLDRGRALRGCQRILKPASVVIGEVEYLFRGLFKIKTNAEVGVEFRLFGIGIRININIVAELRPFRIKP